jgi:hypothetical protein
MIRHLHDVAGLEALEQIAREHDVDIVARGGLARRLFVLSMREPDLTGPDLFDLLPFTADIDLTHTGAPELTSRIMRAIRHAVPMAECFRWDLRSAADAGDAAEARAYGPLVPIHAVTLGVRAGFDDPERARDDVDAGRHRYSRNPNYRNAPRYLEGRDLEVFGALRYLRTVLEDDTISDEVAEVVRPTFQDAINLDTLGRLQESVFLRTRLHRLLKAVTVEARTAYHRAAVGASGLRGFIDYIEGVEPSREAGGQSAGVPPGTSPASPGGVHHAPFHADLDLLPRRGLTSSANIRGDLYRLPPQIGFMSPTLTGAFSQNFTPVHLLKSRAMQTPGVHPLRVSSWVPVVPGDSRDPRMDDGVANEMIHFALVADGDANDPAASLAPADEDIGVTMLFYRGLIPGTIEVATPLATCVSRPYQFDDGRVSILRCFRAACGSLLDRMTRSEEGGTLYVAFVISARSVQEQDPETEALTPITLVGREDYDERLVTS